MEKIVVAHFVRRYLFLTGSWIYHQLTNLSRYQPIVITSALENLDSFPFDPIYCYREPFPAPGYANLVLRKLHERLFQSRYNFCIDVLNREKVELLHAHFGTEGYYMLGVASARDLPVVTAFYGDDVSRLPTMYPKWRKRYMRLFQEGALFLAEGPHMAQCLADLGCPPDKIVVRHLGIPVEKIEFSPRYLAPEGPLRILMAASFREKKGIPYAIRAFAVAARNVPSLELRIIGGASTSNEVKLMQECRKLAMREGIGERVRFIGYIPYQQYLKELKEAHLFLAPSVTASNGDTEGGAPVAIIEASASGLPVIATTHCDIPEVVVDGKTGILVPERNVDSLSEAIMNLVASPDIWPHMGAEGRRHIEKEFNAQQQAVYLESIYDDII